MLLLGLGYRSLLLSNSLSNLVETVRADTSDGNQVVGRAEATDRKVAAVLDGLVAADRRHILRHVWRTGELERSSADSGEGRCGEKRNGLMTPGVCEVAASLGVRVAADRALAAGLPASAAVSLAEGADQFLLFDISSFTRDKY